MLCWNGVKLFLSTFNWIRKDQTDIFDDWTKADWIRVNWTKRPDGQTVNMKD